MVSETSVLVKGEDKERSVPLRRVADGLVDALDEGFSQVDGRGRVERLVGAALRVDVCELRKSASSCVLIELGEGLDVGDVGSG